jgi:predicted Fe-Mo cluster-binding NifX family protein
MKTRVAIPVWQDRISPVFDTAVTVLFVDVDGRCPIVQVAVDLPDGPVQRRVTRLTENGVDVLICGAISRPLREMLEAAGVTVKPFLLGSVDDLIRAFVEGRLSEPRYTMPGCCNGRQRKRRGRRTRTKKEKEVT